MAADVFDDAIRPLPVCLCEEPAAYSMALARDGYLLTLYHGSTVGGGGELCWWSLRRLQETGEWGETLHAGETMLPLRMPDRLARHAAAAVADQVIPAVRNADADALSAAYAYAEGLTVEQLANGVADAWTTPGSAPAWVALAAGGYRLPDWATMTALAERLRP